MVSHGRLQSSLVCEGMAMVMVRVKCVGVGLLWFGLVRIGIDKMDEAMMKHFACTSSLAH